MVHIVSEVFDMAELCGANKTEQDKLVIFMDIIERENVTYLKRLIEKTQYDELDLIYSL